MKLIVGLGNPGKKYINTRHNIGFKIVDRLRIAVDSGCKWEYSKKFEAEICSPKTDGLLIAKPQTMMNNSGQAIKKLITYYSLLIPNLWVIHDDLDIKLGQYKIHKGKGPKEHKGILSVEKALGIKDFWRVRVGVENRREEIRNSKFEIRNNTQNANHKSQVTPRLPGEVYVLQNFTEDELDTLDTVIDKIVKRLIGVIADN